MKCTHQTQLYKGYSKQEKRCGMQGCRYWMTCTIIAMTGRCRLIYKMMIKSYRHGEPESILPLSKSFSPALQWLLCTAQLRLKYFNTSLTPDHYAKPICWQ